MGAVVVWGGDDHEARAKSLATTYATTAQSAEKKPEKISGLDTVVFWGHGDPSKFCGLDSDAFVDLVAAWKKKNSGLEKVEIITCNARHTSGNYPDSYTEQVVTKLTKKLSDIQFRALPVATTKNGMRCHWSVLKWHPATTSWAYIGARTYTGTDEGVAASTSNMDRNMWSADVLLGDFMKPRGEHDGYARAFAAMEKFHGLQKSSAYATKRNMSDEDIEKYNKKFKTIRKESYIIAGNVGVLRWCLSDIN